MPWLQVHILEGTDEQAVRGLMEELTAVTSRWLQVPSDIVRVVINEHDPTRWSVGGVPIAERGAVFLNNEDSRDDDA